MNEVITFDGNRMIYHFDAETLWVEPWGENSFRVRATKMHGMPEQEGALLPCAKAEPRFFQEGPFATLTNGNITCRINKNGKMVFLHRDGRVLLEEYIRNRKGYLPNTSYERLDPSSALELEAREFKPILGGDYALTARFESVPDEKLYGLGQYQQPYLDLKGSELELAQRNSQASVPFMLSSLGYGFLWNNPAIGTVTLGKNVTVWRAQSTKILDYWITAGDTPKQILAAYAGATGHAPVMPEYALGFWQCKLRYQTQEELLEVAREYKRRGVPLSVIVCDFFHWPMQGAWKFDLDYWPDPEGMVRELREMGVELMVSVWPTVDHRSENFAEMLEKGYLIRTDRGLRIAMDFLGNTVHFDATNPGARAYVWEKCKKNYYEKGIRIFWLDEAEPEYSVYDFDQYRYYLGPNLQIGNLYPMMYARAFYEGMAGEGQENVLNLLRCAWAGSQRYGALVWSGDIDSSFESLRNQMAAGLNMGIAGIPWWTTDIGGFHGGNPKDPKFVELFLRWFAWGAFCPVMRLHGYRDPQSKPLGTSGGGLCDSGAPNEIWSYGEEAFRICEGFIALRERMRPYLRELMLDASTTGAPVMRPLFFDFPDDPKAWTVEDQYMFGPDVLVAPVMKAGAESREVYLPIGKRWMDANTGEVYEGGMVVRSLTPITLIPYFLTNDRRFPQ